MPLPAQLMLTVIPGCGFAVGSVFTTALESSDDGSGSIRPAVEPKVDDDEATQPLVVDSRSAQDETTMLSAAEERQPTPPEPTPPETTDPPPETTDPPPAEPPEPKPDGEVPEPEEPPEPDRPSPWRRA